MKQIFINVAAICYVYLSLIILGLAMLYPLCWNDKSIPFWINAWTIYPASILIAGSIKTITEYFKDKVDF